MQVIETMMIHQIILRAIKSKLRKEKLKIETLKMEKKLMLKMNNQKPLLQENKWQHKMKETGLHIQLLQ